VNSILVNYRKAKQLEKLENARVRVTGKIARRHEVEKGEHLVLEVSSMKEAKAAAQPAQGQPVSIQKIAVAGKLVRATAIGGESTGWILELESTHTIDGKQVNSIQVSHPKIEQLEKLENARVRVTGKITRRHGVETGEHLVLNVSSIKEIKATAQPAPAQPGRPSPFK
jgi:tRNA(Ile2) C34 agmatinyltransferase TiaS